MYELSMNRMKKHVILFLQIPAGTSVFMNAFAANHDPEVYPEPFESRPERFVDDNGDVVPPEHPAKRRSASDF